MRVTTWSDGAALWQARHGTPGTIVTESAWAYIAARLDGQSRDDANGEGTAGRAQARHEREAGS